MITIKANLNLWYSLAHVSLLMLDGYYLNKKYILILSIKYKPKAPEKIEFKLNEIESIILTL